MIARAGLLREWLAVAAFVTLLAFGIGASGLLWRVDQTLYDAGLALLERSPADDIVIVAIDAESLDAVGRWPWPRAVHAALLERLAGVEYEALAIDLILAEPEPGGSGDAALAAALRKLPRTVLPVVLESRPDGGLRETLPLPALREAATLLGHVHAEIDIDGIVRSLYLREGLGAARWPHMALAMLEAAGKTPDAGLRIRRAPAQPVADLAAAAQRDWWMHFSFAGPPGTSARIPYVALLRGDVPAAALRGKYVLIGATAQGLGDAYPTPASGRARAMPGVEITANVLDGLRRGGGITIAGPAATGALSAATMLALLAAFLMLSPRRSFWLALSTAACAIAIAFALLAAARLWFGPSTLVLAALLAYPLWSWRRLEAAARYLDDELERLRAEPDILPREHGVPREHGAPRETRAPRRGGEFLQERIEAVRDAVERRRDARRFLAGIIAGMPDGAIVSDIAGNVLLGNARAAACLGEVDAGALRGKSARGLLDRLQSIDAGAAAAGFDALLAGGAGFTADARAADGSDLLVKGVSLASPGDPALGTIVMLGDVTPLKEAERQREKTISFLTHDLRSPQASILALIELQKFPEAVLPEAELLARIERNARRTVDLAEDFVHMTRAESQVLALARFDLAALCRECAEEMTAQAERRRITIECRGDALGVAADRRLLQRAILNLLSNAIKYSDDATTVRLLASRRDSHAVCTVTDQGPGIAPQNLDRLFQSFQRIEPLPGARKEKGIGLGLAFVQTVARRHGGKATVESEPGQGSSFSIWLPLH